MRTVSVLGFRDLQFKASGLLVEYRVWALGILRRDEGSLLFGDLPELSVEP